MNKKTNPDGSERPDLGLANVADEAHIGPNAVIRGGTIRGGYIYSGAIYGGEIRGGEIFGGEIRGGEIFQIFGFGARVGWTIAYVVDKKIMVSAGCFYGTLTEFLEKAWNGDEKQRRYALLEPAIRAMLGHLCY